MPAPSGAAAPGAADRSSIAWQPCGGAQCGIVTVPLDHDRASEATIRLAVVRLPATRAPRLGALVVNPGGPGGSGVAFARSLSRDGLEQFDIVGWDPRGTGGSSPVRCWNLAEADALVALDASPDDAAERDALLAGNRAFAASCLSGSGADLLGHVSTLDTVRDLELVRQGLGEERLTFYGASYGTAIGALYAQTFPAHVGRLVLDAGADPAPTRPGAVPQAVGFDRALARFAAWCEGSACPLSTGRGTTVPRVVGLLDRLDESPVPVGERALTQSLATTGVAGLLYGGQAGWPVLADAVVAAEQGDASALLASADRLNGRGPDGHYGDLFSALPAVTCLDRPRIDASEADASWARTREVAPIFGRQFGPDYLCVDWPVPARPRPPVSVAGARPVLVIGGRHDPATPYEWSESMADAISPSVLLTWNGDGHVAFGRSACVRDAAVAYLVDGRLPEDGATCE